MQQRVWITGLGIVSAIGETVEYFKAGLQFGECGIDRLPDAFSRNLPVVIGARLPAFQWDGLGPLAEGLPVELIMRAEKCARRSPVVIQAAIRAAIQAWHQADLSRVDIPPNRKALIIAGSNLSQNYAYQIQARYTDRMHLVSPRYALHHMDTDHVGTLSEIFGIRGEGFTVGGASASGNVALIKAYQLLMANGADMCMVLGAMVDLSPLEIAGFLNIGAMGGKRFADTPKLACRPFDRDREGFIWGQATGCILLESQKSIERRKMDPVAELAGGAFVLHASRSAAPDVEGEIRAMRQALENSGILPRDVDYLDAHGTSSPLGDETEIRAIRTVFGNRISTMWINSTKGLTGHCLASSGVVEAIATILQMQSRFVHPNRNLVHPIDLEIRFCGGRAEAAMIQFAMSNSFGFGGINSAVVFKSL